MQTFSTHPLEMIRSLLRHRELIAACVKREVQTRYKGSFLGIAWSFISPLLMLAIYTFVFSQVFKARWNAASDSKMEFALVLFAGLIVFTLFSECITRSPGLILGNMSYVKKVIFPLEILPWVVIVNALFHALISLSVWLLAYTLFIGIPPWTTVFLPIIWLPLLLLIVGLCWFLASLGVYVRDIGQIIGVVTTGLMFLSPIFYSANSIPEAYRILIYVNPLTPAVELTRDVLYWGKPPDFFILSVSWSIAFIVAWLGFFWFQKTRDGFADVM